ncbi:RICIN domain-containing protein [Streptomyces sp. NPDC002602]|uniref:RICIN domain-containing protein n=1 Tax=Streptomyces sp. NPDC002602 TaxID=3364654 RepID=UPI0036BC05B2
MPPAPEPATAGAPAILWAVNSSTPGQAWKVTQNGSGTLTITNPATGHTLDSAPADSKRGWVGMVRRLRTRGRLGWIPGPARSAAV